MFTPNDIEVLLHYQVSPAEHPRHYAPAVKYATEMWVTHGLIEQSETNVTNESKPRFSYRVTAKGETFIAMLLSTPLPTLTWSDPRSES